MNYYLDTEFIEYPNTIELISIGIKCEDGRKYYAISSEYDFKKADDWVVKNVIIPLYIQTVHGDPRNMFDANNFHKIYGKPIRQIRREILAFVKYPNYPNGKPQFWGYYADYDWVIFCWIFGRMIDLPNGFPMYCRDLKQLLDETKKEKFPDPKGEHDALVDAEWNEKLHHHLCA